MPSANGNTNGSLKRKAEDQMSRPLKPENQAATRTALSKPVASSKITKTRPAKATTGVKPASPKPDPTKVGRATAPTPKQAPASSKPPPKGSFADIMAQAKAMQDKAPANLGRIQHRVEQKEKLSKVERKRRQAQEQLKVKAERAGKRVDTPSSKGRPAVKKPSPEMPSYKGTAKPAPAPEPPAYRGTAGLPASRHANDRRAHGKRRENEYLGTDEEDEGDYGGYDDYYSDASSDMEAGFDDVADEEGAALKSAQREDEEELRQEMAAKKEKMERQRKLAALASRAKR